MVMFLSECMIGSPETKSDASWILDTMDETKTYSIPEGLDRYGVR